MYNIIRYIRQNRKKIIKILIIVAFLFLLLQILNNFYKNKSNSVSTNLTQNISDKTNGTVKSGTSMVSGGGVPETTLNSVNETVKEFVTKCNEQKVEDAYNMLTDDCKIVLYPDIQKFYDLYYKKLFENKNITYTIENWSGDIYVVRYTNDILSTGKSLKNATYQDYVTVVNKDGEKRININNFIGRRQINKRKNSDDIEAEVLYKDVYMEYEIYQMKVKNNTKGIILMDTLLSTDSIYLKDDKKIKHISFSNELDRDDLKIYPRS